MSILPREKLIKALICGVIIVTLNSSTSATTTNLTCYQCERHDEGECDISDLKPCASSFDRCAVDIQKNAQGGLTIRRECGLAPCGFDDEMMSRGLGMSNCDRSKDTYSCVYCCRSSGCNKNKTSSNTISSFLLISALCIICILNIARDFIPPYVRAENTNFKK